MKEIVEQQNIINEKKVNMIVSASAGSGKTFVMVERILKILTSEDKQTHADLDQMLILTFTNQSASEMSQRLEKKLMENLDQNPDLVSQLDLIRVCDISTIHAFCQKMLKKYFYEVGLSADFSLVEENKQKIMFNKCAMRAISKFREQNAQIYEEILQYFSTTRGDQDVLDAICEINSLMENQIDEKAWLEKIATYLYGQEGERVFEDYFNKKIAGFAGANKEMFSNLIQNAGDREKLKLNLRKIYDFLDTIKLENGFSQNRAALLSFARMPSYSSKEADEFESYAIMLKKKFADKLKRLKAQLKFCDQEIEPQLKARAKNILDNLLAIYRESKSLYVAQKKKKNLLDFCDLEHKFLGLLENEKICQSISENYKYIFIDEFQDTNPVQMHILNKLASSTIMTVGDVKQSIYGFRGSSPEIFQDMMERFQAGEGGVAKTLNCNFRSNKDVLNFANMIFSKILTKTTGGVDYENEAMFEPFAQYLRAALPSVQICLTQTSKVQNNIELDGIYDLTQDKSEFLTSQNLRREARVVAQKILAMKSQKIYDEKLGIFRDTNFSDIMILMRSRTGVDTLCEELIACGVPIVASSKQMLCAFPEIRVLVCLIKLLLNRHDDISLASMLASYFGKLDFDELAEIRIANKDAQTFCECVEQYLQEQNQISQKLHKFFEFFDQFEQIFKFEGLAKALHFAIFESGYNLYLASFSSGVGVERVRTFYDYVEANKNVGVGELLELCDGSDGPTAPNFSTGEKDFVGINTIHSSKGLEYPIVILFGCEHELFVGGKGKKLTHHPHFGLALNYVDDDMVEYASPQFQFIQDSKHKQEFAEELRLLYVAMTRAKNTLILSGLVDFEKVEKLYDEYDILGKNNYLDLVLGCLDEKILSSIHFHKNSLIENDTDFYSVELFEDDLETSQKGEQTTPVLSAGSKEIEKQLNDYINFNYLYKNSINISQKNSVSTLAFDEDLYASKNLAPKKFERAEHDATQIASNDLGTLYHLVFEKIDFFEDWNIVKINEEIKRIVGEQNARLISSEKILKITTILRPYLNGKVFREKEFISSIPHNICVKDGQDDDIIVQGKIDLLILGEKNYIFDYKITRINDENILLNKYKKQLYLYKIAVERALGEKIDGVFVVDVNRARLLKCQNIE